ncbi:hypothetical protein Tco_1525464 [Tanacetum coccineum]
MPWHSGITPGGGGCGGCFLGLMWSGGVLNFTFLSISDVVNRLIHFNTSEIAPATPSGAFEGLLVELRESLSSRAAKAQGKYTLGPNKFISVLEIGHLVTDVVLVVLWGSCLDYVALCGAIFSRICRCIGLFAGHPLRVPADSFESWHPGYESSSANFSASRNGPVLRRFRCTATRGQLRLSSCGLLLANSVYHCLLQQLRSTQLEDRPPVSYRSTSV